jgi:hypothetical protein
MMRTMTLFARPFMKTREQGAATPIYLASSPEVEGVTGQYFANHRPKKSSKSSYRHRRSGPALAGEHRLGRPDDHDLTPARPAEPTHRRKDEQP